MRHVVAFCLLACFFVAACAPTVPKEALELTQESLQQRQLQTRRFETTDEKKILIAGAQVLQDLGFSLEESSAEVGVVVGSKNRDATETGQVVGAVVVALLAGVTMPIDKEQKIRVSLVTHPVNAHETAVRVTFQRIVWNTQGHVSTTEALTAPELYKEFFEKLSQSVFLTAQNI